MNVMNRQLDQAHDRMSDAQLKCSIDNKSDIDLMNEAFAEFAAKLKSKASDTFQGSDWSYAHTAFELIYNMPAAWDDLFKALADAESAGSEAAARFLQTLKPEFFTTYGKSAVSKQRQLANEIGYELGYDN